MTLPHITPMQSTGQPKVVEGAYLRDICAQPDVLRSMLAALREGPNLSSVSRAINQGDLKRIVLTGMGSSLHALYPLHLALCRHGLTSHWVEASELLGGFESLWSRDTLLIVVSQSGESAEVVQLLRRRGEFGRVIGVTNNPESTLATESDHTLLLHAGAEATVSCKTYLASLAVLHWLGAVLTEADPLVALREIEQAEAGMSAYLSHWRDHVALLKPVVEGIESIFVTGRGCSLATAGTGGLILKESTRRPAEGMSCAAFRHGPLEMIGPNVLVLVMVGQTAVRDVNRKLYNDIISGGGRGGLIGPGHDATSTVFRLPGVPVALLPLLEILPVQMLSLALAARDGREAGVFAKASKITVTA